MARILIVDDRATNRDYLVTLLGYAHHELTESVDGEEALEIVRRDRPDLVICDVLMPRMDGFEFIRRLRAETALADTKVLFFSASYIEEDARKLAEAGGVLQVLVKPCPPEEILVAVDKALAQAPSATLRAAPEGFDQEHLRLITNKLSTKEQEQRESERRFSALLANVQLVSLMLDRDARITYCNEFFLRLTGWRQDEVVGRDWFEAFIPPEEGDMRKTFDQLLADAPAAGQHENEILTRSGARRLIRWSNTLLRSASGEVTGTASIGEDVTEQHLASRKRSARRAISSPPSSTTSPISSS